MDKTRIEKPKSIQILDNDGSAKRFYPAAQMDTHLYALLRFFRYYILLSDEERTDGYIDLPTYRVNWNCAYDEISHSTELGAAILKELVERGEI